MENLILEGTGIELDDEDEKVLDILKRLKNSEMFAAFYVYTKVKIASTYKELKKYLTSTRRVLAKDIIDICGSDYDKFGTMFIELRSKQYSSKESGGVVTKSKVESKPSPVYQPTAVRTPRVVNRSVDQVERGALRHSQFFYPFNIPVNEQERLLISDISPFVKDVPNTKLQEILPHADISLLSIDPLLELSKEVDGGVRIPIYEEATEGVIIKNLKYPVVDQKVRIEDFGRSTTSYCSLDSIERCMEFCGVTQKDITDALEIEAINQVSNYTLFCLVFSLLRNNGGVVNLREDLVIKFQYNPAFYYLAHPRSAYQKYCKENLDEILKACLKARKEMLNED